MYGHVLSHAPETMISDLHSYLKGATWSQAASCNEHGLVKHFGNAHVSRGLIERRLPWRRTESAVFLAAVALLEYSWDGFSLWKKNENCEFRGDIVEILEELHLLPCGMFEM